MLALPIAVVLLVPLMASASHTGPPTEPLTVPVVLDLSNCKNNAGALIPSGQNTAVPPDRNNSGSNNRHTGSAADKGNPLSPAVWANADADPKENTLDVSGSHQVIDGLVVSRSHLKVGGSTNQFRHGTEYGLASVSGKRALDLTGSDNCFTPIPDQVPRESPTAPAGFPQSSMFDPDNDGNVLEHFAPGTAPALAAMADATPGPQYFVCGVPDPDGALTGAAVAPGCDQSAGKMDRNVQGEELAQGLYYVTGEAVLSASNLIADITIVSGKQLKVNGSVQGAGTVTLFTPYFQTLLFASQWDEGATPPNDGAPSAGTANTDKGEDALKVEGSKSRFEGIIVATNGRTELAGSQNIFTCPVMGDRVRLNGQLLYISGEECGGPGLRVDKTPDGLDGTVPDGDINLGDVAKFTITVTNNGTASATNVDIDDTLPGTGWSFDGAAPGCTLTPDPGDKNVLHCDVGTLAPDESFSVTVQRATVAADCAGDTGTGVRLDNGSLTSSTDDDATATADGNLSATDPGSIIVRCPDAGVSKTPDDVTIDAGTNIVFTVTVTTNGPGSSPNVVLKDTLPAGFTWTVGGTNANDCSPTGAGIAGGTEITCSFGTIPFPGSRSITLTASTGAANCGQTVTNTATITGDGDRVATNNTDNGSVTVQCGALRILKQSTKTGNPLVSQPGAVFAIATLGSVRDNNNPAATLTDASATVGEVCVANVVPGTYTVNETTPPEGYGGASQTNVSAVVVGGTNCTNNKPTDANSAAFTNPPLGEFTIDYDDLGSGETSAKIDCENIDPTPDDETPDDHDDNIETYTNLPGGNPPIVYTCTISIDP